MLKTEVFTSLLEARLLIEEHRLYCNTERRCTSLGYLTSREFPCHPRETIDNSLSDGRTEANRAA
ncbi:MAG: hypothetical protein ABI718_14605 [Acidobacteriota bacterium]